MITADIHTHSSFSTDSDSPMEEMIEAAIKHGLKTYCVTEHYDLGHHIYDHKGEEGYSYGDMSREEVSALFVCDCESYIKKHAQLKEKYRDDIELLLGIEVGMQEDLCDKFLALVKKYPFDFVIGSAHEVGGMDPYYAKFLRGRTQKEAFRFYFEGTLRLAKACSPVFDTLAHPDYGLRYHHSEDFVFDYADYADILDELLKFLIENKKALECNTGSFSYFKDDNQPIAQILSRYAQLGGSLVTIGSDAHTPDAVARHFERAEKLLPSCGIKGYCVFRNRQLFTHNF